MTQTPPPVLESDEAMLQGMYSEDEKKEILKEIEQAANTSRLAASNDLSQFKPRKRGLLFPLMINLAAAVVIVGAWFGAEAFFQTKEQTLRLKTDKLFSAENSLLASVLEKSKAELDAKNQELSKIQSDLNKLASEKNTLVQQFDTQLSQKEKELRTSLNQQLEAERQRLKSQGISEAEINQKLKDFEIAKNEEFNKNLADFRKQAQAEIDQRTKELNTLQGRLQSTIADQEKLRQDIEKQTKDREKDLQSQISTQNASLEKLSKERDELNLFFRQADTQFAAVREAIESLDYPKAATAVDSLKETLTQAAASTSDAVRLRAKAELSVATSLERTVTALQNQVGKTVVDQRFENLRAQLKKAQNAGTLEEKRTLTAKALETIPEVDAALQILKAWDSQKELAQIEEKLKRAEALMADGKPDEAFPLLVSAAAPQNLREDFNKTWVLRQGDLQDIAEKLKTATAELQSLKQDQEALFGTFDDEAKKTGDLKSAVANLQDRAQTLKKSVDDLLPFKTQIETLKDLYAQNKELAFKSLLSPDNKDFPTAKKLFMKTFQSDVAQSLFPDYDKALDTMLGSQGPVTVLRDADPKPIRERAFEDVLTFTTYLKGDSPTAKSAQETSEKLSRSDEKYKQVVDTIQSLVKTGPQETFIKTNKYRLYGALVSLTGTKAVAEPLTGAKGEADQGIEIRRATTKGEMVLAQGRITSVSIGRIEIEISPILSAPTAPASGDSVYLIQK